MKQLHLPLAAFAAALLAIPTLAFAEAEADPVKEDGPGKHRQEVGERLKMIGERLALTDEQKGKVKEIMEKSAPQAREVRKDTTLAVADRRAKLMEIRKSEMEEIRAVLTPEQQEKWKEMRSSRKGKKADAN